MDLAVSTNWNSSRHERGEAIIDDILSLGVRHAELGYKLSLSQTDGISQRVKGGEITIVSVHSYCPVPMGAPSGHPELFNPASRPEGERRMAVTQLSRNIEFAADLGAARLVVHAGRIKMHSISRQLMDLSDAGQRHSKPFERRFQKLMRKRERKIQPYLEALRRSLDALLPRAEAAGVALCLETMPSWETLPCETEFLELSAHYNSPFLRYWHDIGHAMIRNHLGFIDHRRWAERMLPYMAGVHIHQSDGPTDAHLLPTGSDSVLSDFAFLGQADIAHVLEPASGMPREILMEGITAIRQHWAATDGSPQGDV